MCNIFNIFSICHFKATIIAFYKCKIICIEMPFLYNQDIVFSYSLFFYIAFNCLTMGCLIFLKTLNPHIHFISGKYESSSAVTNVPQDMHSYVTTPITSSLMYDFLFISYLIFILYFYNMF